MTSGSSTALLTVASFAGGVIPPSRFFSSAMLCGAPAIGGDASLAPFSLVSYSVQLFIQDVMITQAQNGIPMLQPRVSFHDDARNGAVVLMDSGAVTINTFEAAYLSVEMNPDPAGMILYSASLPFKNYHCVLLLCSLVLSPRSVSDSRLWCIY